MENFTAVPDNTTAMTYKTPGLNINPHAEDLSKVNYWVNGVPNQHCGRTGPRG